MWIASVLGFYSIVKKDSPGWVVRARTRSDLLNLTKALGMPESRIVMSPHNDYACRIKVDDAELARVFDALRETVDYSNFKNEVHNRRDQADKNGPYMKIWSTMFGIQK